MHTPTTSQESLNPWRSSIEAGLDIEPNQVTTRWVQLGTIGTDGWPAVRTLVFRGFLDDRRDPIQFAVDRRSAKVDQIQINPRAEACWSIAPARSQFRIRGELALITAEEANSELQRARKNLWTSLSPGSRLLFGWPQPGAPRADPIEFETPPPSEGEPPATFALLLLYPATVDHLDLNEVPHRRRHYWKVDSTWSAVEINP